jgi:hypothetical protein
MSSRWRTQNDDRAIGDDAYRSRGASWSPDNARREHIPLSYGHQRISSFWRLTSGVRAIRVAACLQATFEHYRENKLETYIADALFGEASIVVHNRALYSHFSSI